MKAGDLVKIKQGVLEKEGAWMKGYGVNYSDVYKLQQNSTGWHIVTRINQVVYLQTYQLIPSTAEPQDRTVFVYKYITITKDVRDLRKGVLYEVESININGSYMVKHPSGYGHVIVPRDKCHNYLECELKEVPCRCPEFFGVQEIPNQTPMETPVKLTQLPRPQPLKPEEADSAVMKQIKKQKAVAHEVLTFCKIMDHSAFIAGGAPRNWYFNMPANDLDIFLRLPNGANPAHMFKVLEAFGVTEMFNVSTHEAIGKPRASYSQDTRNFHAKQSEQKIDYVLEGKYQGETVQFIFLHHGAPTGNAYTARYFDTSINMLFADWDSEGEGLVIKPHMNFNHTINTGTIFVFENGNAYGDGKHLEKIHNYFPECLLVSHCAMQQVIECPSLAYKYAKDWETLAADPNDISQN